MNRIQKNWLEWIVFGIGLVLVVFTLAYLIYSGLTFGDTPPSLEVRLGTPEQQPHNFIVPVTVINHGDQTAAGVHIEVVMKNGDEEKARAELEIPFVPRRSTKEGWVAFEHDPRSAQLKARILGYEKP